MSPSALTITAGLAWLLVTPSPAAAQTAIQPALHLYASASYDDALQALDTVRLTDLSSDDRVAVEQHRMLCLMALGRTSAAEAAAAALVQARPDFVLGADDASPRVRAVFEATRRRVLPVVTRRFYADARKAYDAGDFETARDGFTRVSQMLADPQLMAADATLDDLRTLTDGFQQLVAAALDRRSSRRDLATVQAAMAALQSSPTATLGALSTYPAASAFVAAPAIETASMPDGPSAATRAVEPAVAPPFAPIDIFTYDWRDKDVVPPAAVAQPISGWWGAMGEPAAGTRLGAVDLVVDEGGRVVDASIYLSVNRVYDTVLLESVKQWRFRPATRDGRPVKYRRVTGVVSSAATR